MELKYKHIISVEDLSQSDVEHIFRLANHYRHHFSLNKEFLKVLQNSIIVNAFFENSTRTKNSFEIAALRLGASVVNFSSSGSSLSKGESLYDTLQTLDAMTPDIIVMRHSSSGSALYATKYVQASVLNAGDGKHEHPSQALLDAFTLLSVFESLQGKTIGIVGDVLHSRVARSNIKLLTLLGAKVVVCGPCTLIPIEVSDWGVTVMDTIDDTVDVCDAIMTLRIQKERMDSGLISSSAEYSKFYGLKKKHILARPSMFVLHPGPVNYGVEIDFEVANSSQSLVRMQVSNGVYIRMAMMSLLTGR